MCCCVCCELRKEDNAVSSDRTRKRERNWGELENTEELGESWEIDVREVSDGVRTLVGFRAGGKRGWGVASPGVGACRCSDR